MTGRRELATSRGDARGEAVQSDLFTAASGVDLDSVPALAEHPDLPAGLLGRIEVLESRMADLKTWVVAEASKGSRFGGALAAVDALDRISSMAAALGREATLAVVAAAGEHLVEDGAEPGAPRLHRDPVTGALVDTGDAYCTDLPLAAAAIGPALRISDPTARERVYESVRVAQHAPNVHARQLAGEWSGFHVRVFLQELAHVDHDVLRAADEVIASVPGRVGIGWLYARIERFLHARRLPTRLEANSRHAGPAARRVTLGPTDLFGMAGLYAYLPAAQARGIDQLLTDLARTAPDSDPRTLDQRRADTFLACFTGPAALNPEIAGRLGHDRAFVADPRFAVTTVDASQQQAAREAWETLRLIGSTLGLHFAQAPPIELNVHIPLATLHELRACQPGARSANPAGDLPGKELRLENLPHLDLPTRAGPPGDPPRDESRPPDRPHDDRQPGSSLPRSDVAACHDKHHFAPYVEGYGSISTTELAGLLDNAVLRRVITDPETGAPLDLGPRRYAPTVAMRRRIQIRDGHCRFPDCRRTATKTEIDHVHEYRADGTGGHTADTNLISLCTHHHRIKHQTPWTPVLHDDGQVTWRNQLLGLTITTEPHDNRQ